MTETFPFAAGQHPMGQLDPQEPERRVNKRALGLGGGVLALALAGGAFLLLSGGGDDQELAVPAGARPAVTHPVTKHPAAKHPGKHPAKHAAHKKLPVYKGAPAGRDPFKPLVTAPPPPAAPTPPPPAPVPSPPSVPIVGPGTGGSLPGGGSGGGSTQPPPTTAPSTVLVFRSVTFSSTGNVPMVEITYNGKAYRLKAGATVEGTLKVVAIQPDDSLAVFQVGDQTFDLHQGQAWIG